MLWKPHVTVAALIERDGKFLLVEEETDEGIRFNQPAGHLEPDESLPQAAVRETREETGWIVRPTHFIGAYQWKAPARAAESEGRHYLRFAFAADALEEIAGHRLDEGIVRALWLSPEELQAATPRHRSPLVWRTVADYLGGNRHPLSLLGQLA